MHRRHQSIEAGANFHQSVGVVIGFSLEFDQHRIGLRGDDRGAHPEGLSLRLGQTHQPIPGSRCLGCFGLRQRFGSRSGLAIDHRRHHGSTLHSQPCQHACHQCASLGRVAQINCCAAEHPKDQPTGGPAEVSPRWLRRSVRWCRRRSRGQGSGVRHAGVSFGSSPWDGGGLTPIGPGKNV